MRNGGLLALAAVAGVAGAVSKYAPVAPPIKHESGAGLR